MAIVLLLPLLGRVLALPYTNLDLTVSVSGMCNSGSWTVLVILLLLVCSFVQFSIFSRRWGSVIWPVPGADISTFLEVSLYRLHWRLFRKTDNSWDFLVSD